MPLVQTLALYHSLAMRRWANYSLLLCLVVLVWKMGTVAASTPMGPSKGLNEIMTRKTLRTAPGLWQALLSAFAIMAMIVII